MKIDNAPSLYQKYKDKKITFYDIQGTVVGYFFTELKNLLLIIETDRFSRLNNIKDFIERNNFTLKDYHGDTGKEFFLVSKNDFDRKDAVEI